MTKSKLSQRELEDTARQHGQCAAAKRAGISQQAVARRVAGSRGAGTLEELRKIRTVKERHLSGLAELRLQRERGLVVRKEAVNQVILKHAAHFNHALRRFREMPTLSGADAAAILLECYDTFQAEMDCIFLTEGNQV